MLVETNDIAATVAGEMTDILAGEPVAVTDDFFISGGDSLRAVELITRLTDRYRPAQGGEENVLGSALLVAIFDDATPQALAAVIERHRR
ncbi:MAG: hypothetical protein HOZ81_09080 [Streptomyces sp.]|uniref:phosphopantetheine-binding protein n=1 Tax=Streptomyces sp. NBC_00663 TaxID=2975801 RepID=UPI00183C4B83|nr:phosphopantetheine-binding protein [Streptomyces sp. NBC_00663]NUP16238.1 hypothetical protein [Streptomyces sp.]NUS11154.1 hypothetical protein [Streptomyces sp.]NUS23678.1 hypothetical protein [Streptomyces sp.]